MHAMEPWRERLLRKAVEADFLSESHADELRARQLPDDHFIDAFVDLNARTDHELAELEALIGPEILSSVYGGSSRGSRRAAPPASQDDLPPLDGLPAIYRLIRRVAEGGMGTVYEAFDSDLDRRVAIKVARRDTYGDELSKILQRERAVTSGLDHPNIVAVYQAGQLTDGRPYYVMPFVGGLVLSDWARVQPRQIREVVTLTERVARAIGAAHIEHVVHRDLTPRNIMVTREGQPKILDFGLAKVRHADEPVSDVPVGSSGSTFDGRIIGTRGYMSPEQRSGKLVGPQSDVYVLGVLLSQLLSAGTRQSNETASESASSSRDNPAAQLEPLIADVRKDLRAIIKKATSEEPASRYASGTEMADDLQRWLTKYPVHAYLGTRIRPLYRASKFVRRQWLFAAAALLAAVIAAGGILGVNHQRRIAKSASEQELFARDEAKRHEQTASTERERAEIELLRDGVEAADRLLRASRFDEVKEPLLRIPASRRSWESSRMRYEADVAPRPVRVLDGHDWGVLASLISPDGRVLLTAGADGRLLAIDIEVNQTTELVKGRWSDERRMYLPASQTRTDSNETDAIDAYLDLAWLEPGRELIGVTQRGRAVVWTLSGPMRRTLFETDKPLTAVAVTTDGADILLGDYEGHLTLVDRQGQTLATRDSTASSVTDIVALADAWCVGHADGTVRIYPRDLDVELASFSESGPIYDLDVHAATARLAVGSNLAALTVIRFSDGYRQITSRQTIALPPSGANLPSALHAVRWSANGRLLLAGDDRGRLMCWDTQTWVLRFVRNDQGPGWHPGPGSSRPDVPIRATYGIEIVDQGKLGYTAGRDGTIKEWNLAERDGIRRIEVGRAPRIAFADGGRVFWSLADDGYLRVWDTTALKQIASVSVTEGEAANAFASTIDGNVAGTAAKRRLRFWNLTGSGIKQAARDITAPDEVLALAIDPMARHAAAYLVGDTIVIWNLSDGSVVAQQSVAAAGVGAATGALLAYSPDGRYLAAAGPHVPATILNADATLAVIARPDAMFGGAGGTAMAWDPAGSGRLVGADTLGRVYVHPERSWQRMTEDAFDDRPAMAAAFTPDGRRVVAASQNGVIAVIEPQQLGVIWARRSEHDSPITGLSCDPRSACLAIAHVDGTIELWDAVALGLPDAGPPRRWHSVRLLHGDQASDVIFRDASVALDARGRPLAVFSRRKPESDAGGPASYDVCLGHLTAKRFNVRTIESTPALDDRGYDSLRRSLACIVVDDNARTAFRRPRSDVAAGAGELVVHEVALSSPEDGNVVKREHGGLQSSMSRSEPITPPGNAGFATWLVPDANKSLAALHFSHQGHYLLASRRIGDAWQSDTVGRQGDGLHMVVARANDGTTYVCFSPTRYNADPLPGVCLALDRENLATVWRETPDNSHGTVAISVAVDEDSQPAMLYWCRGEQGERQLAVAHRSAANEWSKEVVAADPFNQLAPSNLLCDGNGQFHLALFDAHTDALYWLTRREGGWAREHVHQLSSGDVEQASAWVGPVARFDHSGRPIILLGHRSLARGWLKLFQPID